MGMFQHERTYSCPVCGASTTRTQNTNSKSTYRVGQCQVCGYERESKPSRTRNAISVSYISIPSSKTPRKGISLLADNADIPLARAADVLDSDTDTTLEDVQNTADE